MYPIKGAIIYVCVRLSGRAGHAPEAEGAAGAANSVDHLRIRLQKLKVLAQGTTVRGWQREGAGASQQDPRPAHNVVSLFLSWCVSIKMAKLAQLAALVGCVLLLLTIAVVNS